MFHNSPSIMTLIEHNPFPNDGPNFLRIQKYKYWFTNKLELKEKFVFLAVYNFFMIFLDDYGGKENSIMFIWEN